MSDTQASPSLATGHPIAADTWQDFVTRLRHHCNGQGVKWHHTACALFTVQQKRIDYGYEADYAEGLAVCLEDNRWFHPEEYWADLDEDELNRVAQARSECDFLELDTDDQWEVLGELDDHTVTGWNKRWEIVNSHFTKEAAEAFIRRKQHDYPELRVYVESQYYAWEFEAIKAAIIDGTLAYQPKSVPTETAAA
ncbi:MAG: hypothetical protein WCC29_02235 [Pseudomonas farsensis]|uniref:hypothetical protein n=1 Tax=Pseudomonas farsensis TaxID=2745492 RepID=UPI003C7D79AE